jgi:hypothetical protein
MQTKYKGIDQRQIKCCDESETTIEAGISFDVLENGTNILVFHFLENIILNSGKTLLLQKSKSMHLNKDNKQQIINELKQMKWK